MMRPDTGARLALHDFLVLAVFLRFALALVSPDALALDPLHGHIVLGARSPAEAARTLAAHVHEGNYPHRHDPVTGEAIPLLPAESGLAGASPNGSPEVVSILTQLEAVTTALFVLAIPMVAFLELGSLWAAAGMARGCALPSLLARHLGLPPPVPPPRPGLA